MESIEVHSKSFVIRWVDVDSTSQVTWKMVPIKRSINFGVFQHNEERNPDRKFAEATGSVGERLDGLGFASITGGLKRVEARENADGNVFIERRGLLAFVFDNTFSISNSKLVHFSFNIQPLSPPASAQPTHVLQDGNCDHTSAAAAAAAAMALYPKKATDHEVSNGAASAAYASLYNQSYPGSTTAASTADSEGKSSMVGSIPENGVVSSPRVNGLAPFPQAQSAQQGQPQLSLPPQAHQPQHASSQNDLTSPSVSSASRKLSLSKNKSPDQPLGSRRMSFRRNTLSSQSGSAASPVLDEEAAGPEGTQSIRRLRSRPTFNSVSSASDCEVMKSLDGRYVNGFLQKKRRKQFQGFARRYFSLDKQTGLLSYYLNARSSSLRGVMPIKITEIKSESQNNQFTLNSGMEKWTLKAPDTKTFSAWCEELRDVRLASVPDESEQEDEDEAATTRNSLDQSESPRDAVVSHNHLKAQTLDVGNSSSATSTEATLREPGGLSTDVPSLKELRSKILLLPRSPLRQDLETVYSGILKELETGNTKKGGKRRLSPADKTDKRPSAVTRLSQATITPLRQSIADRRISMFLDQIGSRNFIGLSLLGLLGGLLFGFSYSVTFLVALICVVCGGFARFGPSRRGNQYLEPSSEGDSFAEVYSGYNMNYNFANGSSPSVGSGSSGALGAGSGGSDEDEDEDDFSDASDEEERVVDDNDPLESAGPKAQSSSAESSAATAQASTSSADRVAAYGTAATGQAAELAAQPQSATQMMAADTADSSVKAATAETSLYPLPHEHVDRRQTIAGPSQQPPSLLAMLKKAKDPANMTAPITSNEPLSGVQSPAEMYENSDLLDAASKAPPKSHQRVILVALFAVARLSTMRIKERTLRKPFTPLLGETYEMVREDRGFRFVAEKVTHKPEVVATQAESQLWTTHFTSRPHTKMWAKSIQLTDVGHFSVTFPDGEIVSFINPELFIRNILAGERYVEPSGTVTVESSAGSHLSATIEFKAGGMFSGRSEEVKISCGKILYEGKWTEGIYEGGKQVWKPKCLVDNPNKHYGWTLFTAQLNELTAIEKNALPPNDSRLRPDLRLYEDQSDLDKAESLKLALEQKQRERRKEVEASGKQHEPFFFMKLKDSKGHHVLRRGDRNYWVRREQNGWNKIPNYFES